MKIIKVKKKGKTVGRPSRKEILLTSLLEYCYTKTNMKGRIEAALKDCFVYGKGMKI